MRTLILIFSILSLRGMAQFGPAVEVQSGVNIYTPGLRTEDLDGDGDIDIILWIIPGSAIHWYKNSDGLGNFIPQDPIYVAPSNKFDIVDIDLDGDPDIIVYELTPGSHELKLILNLGDGVFGEPVLITDANGMDFPITSQFNQEVGQLVSGDLTNDGFPEIIYTVRGGIRWLVNNGDLTFSPVQSYNRGGLGFLSRTLRVADMDGDGNMDIVTDADMSPGELYTVLNVNGDGTLWEPQILYAPFLNHHYHNVTVIDVDSDGDLDVLDVAYSLRWFENLMAQTGQGLFEYHFIQQGENEGSGSIGQIGCNDDLSIVYGRWPWIELNIWWTNFNGGTGEFSVPTYMLQPKARAVRLADINGDGHLDLVTHKSDSTRWYPYDPDYLAPLLDLQLPFDTLPLTDGPQQLSGGSPEGGTYSLAGSTDTLTVFDPIEAGVGEHQLIYSYTDPFTGCSGTDTALVVVDLSTSMMTKDRDIGIEVFPNPVNDQCMIIFENGPLDLLLIDATGRIVKQWPAASSPMQTDLSEVPAGIYSIRAVKHDRTTDLKLVVH